MKINYKGLSFESYERLYLYLIKELDGIYQLDGNHSDKVDMIKNKIDKISPLYKEEKYLKRIEFWKNLNTKFINTYDIPKLDLRDEDYINYICPALIRCGAIPLKDMIKDKVYKGNYRSNTIGKWNGKQFEVYNQSFNHRFIDTCNHFEIDDNYALFIPLEIADNNLFK